MNYKWPSDHNDRNSFWYLPTPFWDQANRHPSAAARALFEVHLDQQQRPIFQENLRQGSFKQSPPSRLSASLAVTTLGLNLGAVSGLRLVQDLELQDLTIHMQPSNGLITPGLRHYNPLVPLGEPHFSWLEVGTNGRTLVWSQQHEMRSQVRKSGEDSNSLDGRLIYKRQIKASFRKLLHWRHGN